MVKVFSGSEVMALSVKNNLEDAGINVLIKDNIRSASLVGLSPIGQAVELYVNDEDAERAKDIVGQH